ncbi:MAG TPA: DUF411 domain-containing protein [Gemmatimonadales bacterium]|nr:DUF411 domain-containing protein [Gemmatimonadales bacterium]
MTVENRDDLRAIKAQYEVPADLGACHTAVIEEYVIEGHVPANEIRRALRERPRIRGLAVPGMPAGSPGMEVPGRPAEPYRIFMFDKGRTVGVFGTGSGSKVGKGL